MKPLGALADGLECFCLPPRDAVGPVLGSVAVPLARPSSFSTLLTPAPLSGPPGRARLWVSGSWCHHVANTPTEGPSWGWGGSRFLGTLV